MSTIHTPEAGETAPIQSRPGAPKPAEERDPSEVLFPEAKRRERKRRLALGGVAVLVAAGIAWGVQGAGSGRGAGTLGVGTRAPSAAGQSSAGQRTLADGLTRLPAPVLQSGWLTPTVAWAANCVGLYLSADMGRRWTTITPPILRDSACVSDHSGPPVSGGGTRILLPLYEVGGLANPTTPGNGGSSRGGGLEFSADDGATWRLTRSPGCGPVGCGQLSFVGARADFNLVGNSLYAIEDGGPTWTRVGSTPSRVRAVAFATSRRGWGTTNTGERVYGTDNGGKTWSQVSLPVTGSYEGSNVTYGAPSAIDGGAVLLATFTSPRTGASPFVVYTTPGVGNPFSAHPLPAHATSLGGDGPMLSVVSLQQWFVADGSQLFATDDGGAVWHTISPLPGWPSQGVIGISFGSATDGMAIVLIGSGAAQLPTLMRTLDGGRKWTEVG